MMENRPMTTVPLPLNDFLVIDLTAHRAGPTAVRQLADWGAQVIKIEPSGELVDATGSRRDGPDFQNLHRNKRAMTLNLKSDEGRAIFFKLAERADVIVENYKPTSSTGSASTTRRCARSTRASSMAASPDLARMGLTRV